MLLVSIIQSTKLKLNLLADMRKSLSRDTERKAMIPLERPVYPSEVLLTD
jgi:hypothetical protein